MPRGAYTGKQERKADHIEKSYEKRGVSKKEAEERAWRTVNKQDKGGKNDGSGGRQEGLGNPPQARQGLRPRRSVRGFRSRVRPRGARCAQAVPAWRAAPNRRRSVTPAGRGRPGSAVAPGGDGC